MEPIECKLVRFNPRRASRGAPAAEVELNGVVLWMSPRDLKLNIGEFGPLPGLLDAQAAYKAGKDYPATEHAMPQRQMPVSL